MLSEVLEYIPGETISYRNNNVGLTYLALFIALTLSSAIAVGLSVLVGYYSSHIL